MQKGVSIRKMVCRIAELGVSICRIDTLLNALL